MQAVEQLVAISIGVSVMGFVILGICLGRMVRDVAAIQRAIFLQLRQNHEDVARELADIKRLVEE
jgi:hypothetical protein